MNKIIFSKNGKGNISPRITLKNKYLKQLGITPNSPIVNVQYNEKEIIITKSE